MGVLTLVVSLIILFYLVNGILKNYMVNTSYFILNGCFKSNPLRMITFTTTSQYHWRHFRIKKHKKAFNNDSRKEYQPSEILWKIVAPKLANHLLKKTANLFSVFHRFVSFVFNHCKNITDTIFMNTKNSKTSYRQELLHKLTDKINLRKG